MRLPYINIPVRYILAATHVAATNVISSMAADIHTCHIGKPKGRRTIIATGDVNGITDSQNAKLPLGDATMRGISIMASNSGMVIGSVNC